MVSLKLNSDCVLIFKTAAKNSFWWKCFWWWKGKMVFFLLPRSSVPWFLSHLELCSRSSMYLELSSTYSLRMQTFTKPSWCFLNTPGMSSPLAFSTEFSLCVVLSVTGLGSLAYFCVSYKLLFSCHLHARLNLPTLLKCLAPTPRIPHLPSMPYFSSLLSSPPSIHMIFLLLLFWPLSDSLALLKCEVHEDKGCVIAHYCALDAYNRI